MTLGYGAQSSVERASVFGPVGVWHLGKEEDSGVV